MGILCKCQVSLIKFRNILYFEISKHYKTWRNTERMTLPTYLRQISALSNLIRAMFIFDINRMAIGLRDYVFCAKSLKISCSYFYREN